MRSAYSTIRRRESQSRFDAAPHTPPAGHSLTRRLLRRRGGTWIGLRRERSDQRISVYRYQSKPANRAVVGIVSTQAQMIL